MKDIKMQVNLKCGLCANDQFSIIDETIEDLSDSPNETLIKCSDCGRVMTNEELLEENSNIIEANIEDYSNEIIKEAEKKLKKAFKKWK